MQLDHVFVFVDDGPRAEHAAIRAGLVPTHRRRHVRQGTENVCFRFGGSFLELLWVVDPGEIASPEVARTGLAARSAWRRTGACPFGVCLRGPPPFPTWTYTVPFPPGVSVEMATNSTNAAHPLLFAFVAPGAAPTEAQPLGAAITGVELRYPAAPSGHADALTAVGVTEVPGQEPRLTLTLVGGDQGRILDVPEARLRLRT